MAKDRLAWLAELSMGFKRHRCGRGGLDGGELHRGRLRVTFSALPLKPGELAEAAPKRRRHPGQSLP